MYIYFKHGRSWCYVGPLSNVDLSNLINDLRDYHSLTTIFGRFLGTHWGGGLKLVTLMLIATSLLITDYFLNFGGCTYVVIITSLISVATLLYLAVIAIYELSNGM